VPVGGVPAAFAGCSPWPSVRPEHSQGLPRLVCKMLPMRGEQRGIGLTLLGSQVGNYRGPTTARFGKSVRTVVSG